MFDVELVKKRQQEIDTEAEKAIDRLTIYLNLYSNIAPKVDLLINLVQQNSEFFDACPDNCSLERIYKKLEKLIEESKKKAEEQKDPRKYLTLQEIVFALGSGRNLDYRKLENNMWVKFKKRVNWKEDVVNLLCAGALFRYEPLTYQIPNPAQAQAPKEKIYRWVNLYTDLKHNQIVTSCLYESEEAAFRNRNTESYLTTVKLCCIEPPEINSQTALGTKPA